MTDQTPIHLKMSRQICIIWNVEDVLCIRPDLTEDQAWQVLHDVDRYHDAGIGINWEVLEVTALSLFGDEKESAQ
jgi:hypothetical protein